MQNKSRQLLLGCCLCLSAFASQGAMAQDEGLWRQGIFQPSAVETNREPRLSMRQAFWAVMFEDGVQASVASGVSFEPRRGGATGLSILRAKNGVSFQLMF